MEREEAQRAALRSLDSQPGACLALVLARCSPGVNREVCAGICSSDAGPRRLSSALRLALRQSGALALVAEPDLDLLARDAELLGECRARSA